MEVGVSIGGVRWSRLVLNMEELGLWRCQCWDRIIWKGRSRCLWGYLRLMNPSGGGVFCLYLFCCASCTRASVGMRLSWSHGEILIEVFHNCDRLCGVFIADISILGQGRTPYLLMKIHTWRVFRLVEISVRAVLVMSNHCCYKFPWHLPLW